MLPDVLRQSLFERFIFPVERFGQSQQKRLLGPPVSLRLAAKLVENRGAMAGTPKPVQRIQAQAIE